MKNWTIGQRIVLGFTTLWVTSAALGLFAVLRLADTKALSNRISADCLPGVYGVGQTRIPIPPTVPALAERN